MFGIGAGQGRVGAVDPESTQDERANVDSAFLAVFKHRLPTFSAVVLWQEQCISLTLPMRLEGDEGHVRVGCSFSGPQQSEWKGVGFESF